MDINNDKKSLNVPPLRFPEFKGEWKKGIASNLLKCFSTNSLTWDDLNFSFGKFKDLHYGLIHKWFDRTVMSAESELIPWVNNGREPKKFTNIENGDLILADASEDTNECGEPVELINCSNVKLVSGLHTIHCRDKKEFTEIGFKGFLFRSSGIKKQLFRLCEGTKIYSICPSTLNELFLNYPSKEEQKKIVTLLNQIEERIIVQRKIIEDFLQLKKSLIDSFFNSADCSLSSMIEESSERANQNYSNYEVYSVSNSEGFIKQTDQFGGKEIASQNKSNYKIVGKGMFAYNPARINVGSIARNEENNPVIVSPMYVIFAPKQSINPAYLECFFESSFFSKQMKSRLEGSVRQCLTFDGLSSIPIKKFSTNEQPNFVDLICKLKKVEQIELQILEKIKEGKNYLLNFLFI